MGVVSIGDGHGGAKNANAWGKPGTAGPDGTIAHTVSGCVMSGCVMSGADFTKGAFCKLPNRANVDCNA